MNLSLDDLPTTLDNWINGQQHPAASREVLNKINPHDGNLICRAARSREADVARAVEAAVAAQPSWAATPPVRRGMILHEVVSAMASHRQEIARVVAEETGKSPREALGETDGAIQLGLFMASEGQRLYGRTTTSGTPNKYAMTFRQPVGVAGLIIAANTPIANVAWKVFPALICGNSAVLKAAEDTPATAWIFGAIAHQAGLPPGVLNIIQGYGPEAGAALVADPRVGVVSFTGSSAVGRQIAVSTAQRLAKVSLELGGKNPLVVCDDADLDLAVRWAMLSAFSNAGQRCASGSRLIVFQQVYEAFADKLVAASRALKAGNTDHDDLGPVINGKQLKCMLGAVESAKNAGARLLTGGVRLSEGPLAHGFYMAPTLLDNLDPADAFSTTELFGPLAGIYQVANFQEALALANHSPYGLTAAIHTRNIHRAWEFAQKVQAGVAVINGGTYGSEPHLPFGGVKQSGNGSREPGTEALDIYSNLKNIYLNVDPAAL